MSSGADGFESEIDSEFSATIRLDPRIYTREAILRASYWHTNTAYIVLPESSDDSLIVKIRLKHSGPTL